MLVADGYKLLVLDDESEILNALDRIFSSEFNVFQASSTEEATSILVSNEISVAIIDYNLNEYTNGIDFAVSLKYSYPLVQVVMLTGQKELQTVVDALNSGSIDTFLNKPLDLEELKSHVNDNLSMWLKNKQILEDIYSEMKNFGPEVAGQSIQSYVPVLQEMLNQGVDLHVHVGSVKLIGIGVSRQLALMFKYFFSDVLNVTHETIFAGFIATLLELNKELFLESEGHKFHELSLNEVHVKIIQNGELTYMFFTTGHVINKKLIMEVFQDFITETEPLLNIKQSIDKPLQSAMENYTKHLSSSVELIH